MKFRSLIVGALAGLLSATLALQAQVPSVNSTLNTVFNLVYDNSTMKPTYSASGSAAMVASGTDICTLSGSSGKNLRVRRVVLSVQATAVQPVTIGLAKRSTASGGGTSTDPTVVAYDSNSPASSAVMELFTANPTVGTLVGVIADLMFAASNATTGVGSGPQYVDFGKLGSPIVLRSAAETLAVSGVGVTVSGGVLFCTFEWTEDTVG